MVKIYPKLTRLQRRADCIDTLRQRGKCFNVQCVKVDTQVPRNHILIRNDDVRRCMVVVNETRDTTRWTTRPCWHSTITPAHHDWSQSLSSCPSLSRHHTSHWQPCHTTTTHKVSIMLRSCISLPTTAINLQPRQAPLLHKEGNCRKQTQHSPEIRCSQFTPTTIFSLICLHRAMTVNERDVMYV